MVCNLAEGLSKEGAARRRALDIARGEAGECNAVLDCVSIRGAGQQQQKLRRVAAMLLKLAR